MNSNSKKWLIKTRQGKIQGPLSTRRVIEEIQLGDITEEDSIAVYPSSNWIPITHNPDFYDILLGLLTEDQNEPYKDLGQKEEAPQKKEEVPLPPNVAAKKDTHKKDRAKNNNPPRKADNEPHHSVTEKVSKNIGGSQKFARKGTQDESVHDESIEDEWTQATGIIPELEFPKRKKSKKSDGMTIELASMGKAEAKAKLKLASLPVLFIVVAVLLVAYVFLAPEERLSSRVRLIGPVQKRELSRNELVESFRIGSEFYFLDTHKNYVKAQSKLSQVLEAYPSHLPALNLLCMTYLELWPFAYKDNRDYQTLANIVQMAAKQDPSGLKGNSCNVVQFLIKGQHEEAESFIEGVLSAISEDEAPPTFYYYLKALILDKKGSYAAALGYVSSVQEILPQWMKAYIFEAKVHTSMKDYASAARRYKQVLDVNPQHKEAMILWGQLEYQHFFRRAEAKTLLRRAVSLDEFVSPKLQSDALTTLAEIAIYENDKATALGYAKKAYASYSSNKVAESIVRNLGGSLKGELQNVKGSQLVDEGEIFESQGDCNSAQALYKTAFEKNQNNGIAALKAAKCLWKLSLSTESIEWLNKAIKADPNLIEAYVTLSDYYSQRYDFEAAAAILVKANRISPKNFEVFRSYAQIELRRRNYKGAITYGKNALALFESDVETLILLIKAYLRTGEINEAYNLANRAIELNPNNREANIEFANTISAVQGAISGIDYMSNIVSRFPLILEYRLALGRMYFADERFNDARIVFEQILSINPNYKDAKVELGRTYKNLNALDLAMDQFLQSAVMDPADAVPLYEAGLLYMQMQKPDKAIIQFERVLRINKIYPLAHYQIGRAALMMKDTEKAIEYAQKERKINNKLAESYVLAAEAYMQMEQFSLCAQEYHNAINLSPQGALIYLKIAICHRRSGNLDIAESMLKQAEDIENGLADIYREQGQIFEARGFMDRAIQAYDRYLALSPSAPDAPQVKQKLQSLGAY